MGGDYAFRKTGDIRKMLSTEYGKLYKKMFAFTYFNATRKSDDLLKAFWDLRNKLSHEESFLFQLVQSSQNQFINNGTSKFLKSLEFIIEIKCIFLSEAMLKDGE